MADEITRLVTRLELQNNDAHDRGLDVSIGKINQFAAAGNGAFGNVGNAAAAIAPKMDSAAQGISNVERAMERAASKAGALSSPLNTTGSSAGNLTTTFKGVESAVTSLGSQITSNRQTLAGLSSQMTDLSVSGRKYIEVTNEQGKTSKVLSAEFVNLRSQYQTLDAQTRVLTADKSKLSHEARTLESALKAEEAELKKLASAIDPVEQAFRDLGIKSQSSLQETAQKAKSAYSTIAASGKASAEDLIRAQASVDTALKRTQAGIDPVEQAFKDLGLKSQASLQQTAQKAEAAYKTIANSGKASAEDLERAQAKVNAAFRATQTESQKLSQAYKSADDSLAKSARSAASVGQTMTVGLTLPLTLLGKKAFDVGAEYERAMNVLQVATRASAAEMSQAAKVAEALGNDIKLPGVSAADAAIAMTELGKAGFSLQQSIDGARGVLELSTAATIGAADAAKLTTAALQAFGLEVSESSRVADLLAASATATSAEITDVGLALQQSAASAAALRIPIDDLVTSISLMATAGIKGSDAGTSLKTFMNALTPSTKAATAAMQELGIHAFDSTGKFVGLEAVIKQAAPALARMTDQQRANAIETAFGSDAQRAANIILGVGVEKFREMDVVVNKAGAAQEMAAAKSKGLSGAMDGLTSSMETVAINSYKSVAPGLEGVVRKVADMTTALSTLNPTVLTAGTSLLLVAAASGPMILVGAKVVQSTQAIMNAMAYMNTSLLTAAAGWGVLVAAGGWAIYELYKQAKEAGSIAQMIRNSMNAVTDITGGLQAKIDAARNAPMGPFLTPEGEIQVKIDRLGKGLGGGLAGGVAKGFGEGIKKHGSGGSFSKPIADEFQNGVAGLDKAIAGLSSTAATTGFDKYFDRISKSLKPGAEKVKAEAKVAVDAINELLGAFGSSAKIKDAQLLSDYFKFLPTLEKAREFKALKEAINDINLDRANAGLAGFSDKLDLSGNSIELNSDLLKALQQQYPKTADAIEKAGLKLKGVAEAHFVFANTVAEESKIVSTANADMARQSAASFQAYIDSVNRAAEEAPKPWEASSIRITQAVDKIKEKIAGIEELNVLNARIDISSSIISQLDHLAAVTGQDKDVVLTQFRDMVAGMSDGSAEVQKQIALLDQAILNSQLSKLEDVWGRPAGRAIEFILVQMDKLDAGTAKKAAAIGAVLSSLPDALGGKTLNKWIDNVNKYVNFFNKVLDLMDAFGIKLPGSAGRAMDRLRDILNNGAGNNTQIMREMSAEMQRIMEEMSRRVVQTIGTMVDQSKAKISELNDSLQGLPGQGGSTGIINSLLGGGGNSGILGSFFGKKGEDAGGQFGGGLFGGLFDSLTQQQGKLESILDEVFGPVQQSAGGAGGDSGKLFADGFVGKLSLITSGLATFFGTRGQGRLTGLLGGAAAGAQIGSIFGGIGAAVGAGIGAIAGLFFGTGKSELAKAQEAAALAEARAAIKRTELQTKQLEQEVQQAIIRTGSDLADLMDKAGNTALVPKGIIRKFVNRAVFFLRELADGLKTVAKDATPEMKAAAENFQPVIALAASVPEAIDAAARSMPVPQNSFDTFFSNLTKLWDGFSTATDDITNKASKHAKKFATRWEPVLNTIAPSVEASSNFFKVRRIDEADVVTWVANIVVMEKGIAQAADSLDKYGVKQGERLANAGSATLDFMVKYADTQDRIVNITTPDASSYERLFAGAKIALGQSITFAKDVEKEGLALSAEVQKLGTEIFGGLNAEIDFISKAGGLKDVDFNRIPDTIRALSDATKLAVQLSAEAGNLISQEMKDEAQKYAIAAKDVVSVYDEAAKAFGGASLNRDIYPATIQNIANGIELSIAGIIDIRKRVTGEMLAEVKESEAGLNAVASIIGNQVSAFKDLGIDEAGKAPTFSIERIDALLNISEYSLNRVVSLSKSISASDRAAAVSFSTDTRVMSENMSSGLGFIKALSEQAPTSVASFDAMTSTVVNFGTAIENSLDEMARIREMAAEFLSLSGETKADITAGISNLAAAAASAITAASGGSGFAPQSVSESFTVQTVVPTVPVAPVAPVAPSHGNSQTVIHQPFNFNGNVYLNGNPAPQEVKAQTKEAMEEWWQEKIREEQHGVRQQ